MSAESDVFLCYSRRDRAFVERLHAALVEGDKEVYVDWEDIPDWSPDYEAELRSAIDASDTFVFVLSPDSLASPHCGLELEHAADRGKRIRPVQRRPPEGPVPEALRHPQWIDFTADERFDEAATKLLEAVSVDSDWVRRHTRIGLRAGEWDRRGRDSSLLLRGSDLREAETWRDGQTGKEPPPTELQVQYVGASRQASTRRLRVTVGAVVVALMLAVALAVFAVLQRNQAIEQRDRAVSLALASAAGGQLDERLDLSLLLALEANSASPTAEARTSMLAALERARRSPLVSILRSHPGSIDVAYSPAGPVLASAGHDGAIRLWDTRERAQVGEALLGDTEGPVWAVAFSPDGRVLASGGQDGAVRLWDTADRHEIGDALEGHTFTVDAVAFSPDGKTLASASWDGTIRVWDVPGHRPLGAPLRGHDGTVSSVAFSRDGRTLASAGIDGTVRLWAPRAQTALGELLRSSEPVYKVAFSPDGRTLASSGADGLVRLWDVRTGTQRGTVPGLAQSITSIAFSPSGRTLAVADLTVRLWDVGTLRQVGETFRGDENVSSIAFSSDGRTLAANGASGIILLWDVSTPAPLGRALPGVADDVWAIDFSPDEPVLASVAEGKVSLWNVASGKELGELPLDDEAVRDVAFSAGGGSLVTAAGDGTVRLWDARARTPVGKPLGNPDFVQDIAVDRDGTTVVYAISAAGNLRVWDTRAPAPVAETPETERVRGVAFSPDGRTFATAGQDGIVRLFDTASREELAELTGHSGAALAVSFSPDGRTLASVGDDGDIHLWDVRARKPLGDPLGGHEAGLHSVAFSPDGRTVASGGLDQAVHLWDLATRQELGPPLRGHTSDIVGLSFGPDGRTLASASRHGPIRLWDGIFWRNASELRELVCPLVVGNLTREEWARYVPGLPYHATCDGA